MILTYSVGLNQKDVDIAVNGLQSQIDKGLSVSVDHMLTFIENSQIKAYTANARPSLPEGSDYIRTFELQESSEKIHQSSALEGVWKSDLDHAKYVIGQENEQAPIHQGRWKSIEVVESELLEAAPKIIQDTAKEYTK
jgi:hypothetical protein